jgi:hypothetical protein
VRFSGCGSRPQSTTSTFETKGATTSCSSPADHPHGLGVAVEVHGELYVRIPDELAGEEFSTLDADVAIEWTRSL